jgi:hypothetical protein
MNPVILLQVLQAVIAAVPSVAACIESICAQVAQRNGLDPVALTKIVTEPAVSAVDASVDAQIEARDWPVK